MKAIRNYITTVLVITTLMSLAYSSSAVSETFTFVGPSGGVGGNFYSAPQTGGWQLSEIRVRSGAFIDGIQLVYVDVIGQKHTMQHHGGNGGHLDVFKLNPGEYVTRVTGKYGRFVDSLTIATNQGRIKGWGGGGGSAHYTYSSPPGTQIHGFFGGAGQYVDSIGVVLKTP